MTHWKVEEESTAVCPGPGEILGTAGGRDGRTAGVESTPLGSHLTVLPWLSQLKDVTLRE
jgi:hypothetical protein